MIQAQVTGSPSTLSALEYFELRLDDHTGCAMEGARAAARLVLFMIPDGTS